MTQYTPNLAAPYPEDSDAPRGWEQLHALADAVDPLGRWAVCSIATFKTDTATGFQPLPVTRYDGTPDLPAGPQYGVTARQSGYYTVGLTIRIAGQNGVALSAMPCVGSAGYGATYVAANRSYAWSGSDFIYVNEGDNLYPQVDGYGSIVQINAARWWIKWLGPASTNG